LRHAPQLAWRCDRCQQQFEVGYDDQAEQETNLPTLTTSQDQTFCDNCAQRRFGPGPYEPE
jgi:DNA-directed RNA polymerase subunit RPC12/RpoP